MEDDVFDRVVDRDKTLLAFAQRSLVPLALGEILHCPDHAPGTP
jgi:hypothetical protein